KATALPALAAAAPALGHAETLFVFVQNGIPWWYAQGLEGGSGASRPRPPNLARLDPGGLLAGAVAAFFAALSGGHHRDKSVQVKFFTVRRAFSVSPTSTPPT
ncbi:MAG: hypothetical protein ABMA14_27395, partial [Hyphomonadaceae bacterium]